MSNIIVSTTNSDRILLCDFGISVDLSKIEN